MSPGRKTVRVVVELVAHHETLESEVARYVREALRDTPPQFPKWRPWVRSSLKVKMFSKVNARRRNRFASVSDEDIRRVVREEMKG